MFKGCLCDIIDQKTVSFTKLQKPFAGALKELQVEGKLEGYSYPEIEKDGKYS